MKNNISKIKNPKINISPYNIMEALFALSLILNFQTMWTTIKPYAYYIDLFSKILLVFSGLICVCFKLNRRDIKLNKRKNILVIGVILFFYMGFYIIWNPNRIRAYLWYCLCTFTCFLFGAFCYDFYGDSSIIKKLTKIITALALVSLIFWIFGSFFRLISPTGNILSGWTGEEETQGVSVPTYFYLHFEPQIINIMNINVARNSGIFTEAPMCSFIYSLGLIFNLFVEKRTDYRKSIIMTIGIITTFATTGIVVMLFAYAFKFILSRPNYSLGKALKILVIPFAVIIVTNLIYNLLLNRLGTSSGSIRLDDFRAGYEAWKESPFWGAGFGNEETLKRYMSPWRWYNQGFSNSIFYLLAQCGIYIGVVYIICFFIGIRKLIKSRRKELMVFYILFVFMFVVTISCYQSLPILVTMGAMFIKKRQNIALEECKHEYKRWFKEKSYNRGIIQNVKKNQG